MPALNVLIVDDDKAVCEYLEDFLANEGYTTATVSSPLKALEKLKHGVYHVMILDLMMPEMNGVELLERIRQVDDDIAIIVLTGYPSVETASTSIKYDISAYFKKPFSSENFREVIGQIAKKKGLVLRKEDELHATIGRSIRLLRKDLGLTLKQMSRRTNLSVSLLSQIERAESSASVSSLFKVATALDVPITRLFGGY
ncbi:MAG: response regulator [Pseudomonadota bacterium]